MTFYFLTTHISFSVCDYFAPRQDKKVSKLSIVSIADSAGGIEGDCCVTNRLKGYDNRISNWK
jgi:hypothetical protein